jgi:transposase InsO family protein
MAGLLKRWNPTLSNKGNGFIGPKWPHQHWHIDVSYLNIRGTFYYLCSILDGYSRYIVHWEIRESMKEADIEIILQRAKEKFPGQRPRIISDNGPQFIARDFKEFVRVSGMTHVRTSAYYPQSNGKIERWHQSLKRECIRPRSPLSLDDAREIVAGFVDYYNSERLHSAIGFIAPKDKLKGNEKRIFSERDRKLEQAREKRKRNRLNLGNELSKNDFNKRILPTPYPRIERRWSVTGTESLRNGVQVTLHRSGSEVQKNLFPSTSGTGKNVFK